MKDQLKLWNQVCETDATKVKDINLGGRKFASVQASHQLHEATKMFGPFGIGFGFENTNVGYAMVEVAPDLKKPIAHFSGTFWYIWDGKRGAFPIHAEWEIRNKDGNEWAFKVQTRALSKALSRLGFNADLFDGLFDNPGYAAEQKSKYTKQAETRSKALSEIGRAVTSERIDNLLELVKKRYDEGTIDVDLYEECIDAAGDRLEWLEKNVAAMCESQVMGRTGCSKDQVRQVIQWITGSESLTPEVAQDCINRLTSWDEAKYGKVSDILKNALGEPK